MQQDQAARESGPLGGLRALISTYYGLFLITAVALLMCSTYVNLGGDQRSAMMPSATTIQRTFSLSTPQPNKARRIVLYIVETPQQAVQIRRNLELGAASFDKPAFEVFVISTPEQEEALDMILWDAAAQPFAGKTYEVVDSRTRQAPSRTD